jgi:drug/metabolite transporter (DMT)-like permease
MPDGRWISQIRRLGRFITVTKSRRPIFLLAVLALIWGSSFLFIKVAVRDLPPSTLVAGRLGLAALVLAAVVPLLVGRGTVVRELRDHWRALVVVGLVNMAVPFWLLSWGETRIDSGLASIIQASVPIFVALLAFGFFPAERVTGRRLVGVAIGFVGVALLVGAQPHGKLLGALAVVGMALCYAIAALLTRKHLQGARPQVIALGTISVAALSMLPAGVAQAPSSLPGWKALASIAVLGVVCTAFAFLVSYTIVARAGAGYASLVTYLVPPVALFYGALFLGESIGVAAAVGLVLILGGVALGTRPRRRGAGATVTSRLAGAAAEPTS